MRHEIDACQYLYLLESGEPEDNVLQVVIEEAEADRRPRGFRDTWQAY